jgi:hypothetical protein
MSRLGVSTKTANEAGAQLSDFREPKPLTSSVDGRLRSLEIADCRLEMHRALLYPDPHEERRSLLALIGADMFLCVYFFVLYSAQHTRKAR